MLVKKCDCCGLESDVFATITYEDNALHKYRPLIVMQGTRGGTDELCPDCYRAMCWAIGNVWQRKYYPTNPVKDSNL